MKKSLLMFIITGLILTGLILWMLRGGIADISEILMAAGVLILAGFAIFMAYSRLKSRQRGEPAEDELSRQIVTRTASLSYYISLYWWLALGILSDRIKIPTHSLVGLGILGMALIFFATWIVIRLRGLKT
jgi:hypothetical protein